MKPFLKWAGGKRRLLPYIKKYINDISLSNSRLYEPFVGGGSLFLDLRHDRVTIYDLNEELINCYKTIKNKPTELILKLKEHQLLHSKEYYYKIRSLDRENDYKDLSDVDKAARMIYLNKTCYNGLYRVNSKGQFNTPIGRYDNPIICDEKNILEISEYLNINDVVISNGDFEEIKYLAQEGDWIYFDPPYDYDRDGFVGYVKEGFGHSDLDRLKELCDTLIDRGCYVLISNNDTKYIRQIFEAEDDVHKYAIENIKVKRFINRDKNNRKHVDEVLIYGSRKK